MPQGAARVLVVEDDRDFAESLAIVLGTRDCTVDCAYTGEEAVRLFHERLYDITFMDIKLPGKNGVQVLAEILAFAPQARIVMMTGFSDPALLEQARQAGAMDVLRKPFRMKDLLAYVERQRNSASPPSTPPSPAVH